MDLRSARVLMLTFSEVAHDSRLWKEIRTLSDAGAEVAVLGVRYGPNQMPGAYAGAPVVRVNVGGQRSGSRRFLRGWWAALRPACRARAAVYHAMDLYLLPVAALCARLHGAALVYDSREYYRGTEALARRPLRRAFWGVIERVCIRRTQAVLVVSPAIGERLAADYALLRSPITVRNAPTRIEVDAPPEGDLRCGVGAGLAVALYLGHLQRGRGLEVAIEALAHAPSCALVCLGDGPLRDELVARAQRLGVTDRVHLRPPVAPEVVIAAARSADIGLVLIEDVGFSYRHALPNKLFQVLAAGLPVIASDLPGVGTVVREAGAGLVVDSAKPAAIGEALERLAADAALRDRCRAASRKAAERYVWEREAAALLDAYRALPERCPSPDA